MKTKSEERVMKKCNKCGEVKPLDGFHKNKPSKDGYNNKCKECRNAYCRSIYPRKLAPGEKQVSWCKGTKGVCKAWNKGLTKETDERVAKYSKPRSEEFRKNLSIKRQGSGNPMFGVKPTPIKQIEYKGIMFRSSYEVERAKFLDENNIEWKYEEKTYTFGEETYTPDFFIYDNIGTLTQIEDVKGSWWLEKTKDKIDRWKDAHRQEASIFSIVMKEDLYNEPRSN